ncbi:MAG TPA: hypothetical protein PLM07_02850 [Candidatus Rifleibacterium sp.]|nr:hypothetical protein [Candidatus Rifleibacterium sp.]HPT44823.1 hypothetical protein [Candidatus Rifleibacterium sp.]
MEIKRFVEVLRQNELLFADMYRECVRLFPAHKEDFEVFVREEEAHACVFARIAADLAAHPANWRMGKVSLRAIEVVQQQIKDALVEIRSGNSAPRYAITMLRNFEQGMGERASEKVLETDSESLQKEVAAIRDGFTGHLTRLQQLEREIFPASDKDKLFEI